MLLFRHVKFRKDPHLQCIRLDHCRLSQIDGTEINVAERITKVVARVSSRKLGGTELSENEKWVDTSVVCAIDGFHGAQKTRKYPHALRPVVKE